MHNAHCYKYTCVYLYKKKTHTGVHLNVKICVNTYACICKTTCNQTHLHWFINTYAYNHIYIMCVYICILCIYIYVYVAMLMYRHVNIAVHIYMYGHVWLCFLFMLSHVYIFECVSIDTHSHKDHHRSICIWLHLHTVYIIHILHIQNTIHDRERGSLPLRLPRWCLPAANMSQWKKKTHVQGEKTQIDTLLVNIHIAIEHGHRNSWFSD